MKIIYLQFSLDHEMLLPSIHYMMLLVLLQSLKLLRPAVYEKIQLHDTARTNICAHALTDGRTDSDGPTLV